MREKLGIFDFHCDECQEAGRDQPIQIVLGATTEGRFSDNEIICGTCDSVIYTYTDDEMNDIPYGSIYGDNEDLRLMMAGKHPIQLALDEEGEEE